MNNVPVELAPSITGGEASGASRALSETLPTLWSVNGSPDAPLILIEVCDEEDLDRGRAGAAPGVVAALDAKTGEYIAPGAPVVHLADLSAWQIETTDLTELNIARVREDSQAAVTFDAIPNLELLGTVSHIRALGENKQGDITYTVTVQLDRQDPRLRWNMTASVAMGQ